MKLPARVIEKSAIIEGKLDKIEDGRLWSDEDIKKGRVVVVGSKGFLLRVLYSHMEHFDNLPKNTIVILDPLNEGTRLYFGIARCNLLEDVCVRGVGRTFATERALRSKADHANNTASFLIDENKLYGYCEPNHLRLLLKYFYSLDDSKKHRNGYLKRRKHAKLPDGYITKSMRQRQKRHERRRQSAQH